jgi:hypothetical protein
MADELAALRAVSQHLSKRGESIKDFLARVSAKKSGHVLDFEAFYGVLASDGFRAPSASVTILEHTLTGTITEKKLSSMLAMADAIDDSAASGSTSKISRICCTLHVSMIARAIRFDLGACQSCTFWI